MRSVLLRSAAQRLNAARADLHRVPDLQRLHDTTRAQLSEHGAWIPLVMLVQLWWCAFCIERSARHARRAEGGRR